MTTDIATVETESISTANFDVKAAIMTAYDTTTIEGQKFVFNASNNAGALDDLDTDTVHVTGIIVKPTSIVDREGEVKDLLGTTFITDNGSVYTVSTGIARCAMNLFDALNGVFPAEGITIRFSQRKLSGGRTMRLFEWV